MRKLVLSLLLAALGLAAPAAARVRVVTTIQTFKLIAAEIGGERVKVTALVEDNVDPHFVDPRPSLAVTLSKADLLIHVGLELERGWLPPLVDQSRNPAIRPGAAGELDASTVGIPLLDVGVGGRAQGDLHPMGNPHYWITPDNAVLIARGIAARLKALDPAGAADYDANLAAFEKRVGERKAVWADQMKGLAGVKVVTYHRSWTYLTTWLGLAEIGQVEPKPGIPPDPQHLAGLVRTARAAQARLVLIESFYARNTAQRVADLAQMKLLVLPSDASSGMRSYTDFVDVIVALFTAR